MEINVNFLLGSWITLFCAITSCRSRNHSFGTIQTRTDEERLLEELFDGYNTAARPVINSSKTVEVKMMFSLLYIKELNLKDQVLTTTGSCILEWQDERLRWDEKSIQIHQIAVEASHLWTPEFVSINGAENLYIDVEQLLQIRAIILSDGRIHWEPSGMFKTVCEIDITYYPFDTQFCKLVFGSMTYYTPMMNLTTPSNIVILDSYERNGEWVITDTSTSRHEFFYDCCPDMRFPNVVFSITLKRRYTFYIMNIIVPSSMTSVLLLSIFFCPPAEKISIGIMVLLSFELHLLNIAESIPKSSTTLPILGVYLTCTMCITTFTLLLTICVLNLHHITDRPVPSWINRLVLVYMATLLCKAKPKDSKQSLDRRQNDVENENEVTFIESIGGNRNQDEKENWSREWKQVADVMDRLFFWMILAAYGSSVFLLIR